MVDVIVIGGGIAGLSAATELAGRGRRVLLLEARPHLGGRATAFVDPVTGERTDSGPHLLFGCYRETFRFLDRIGTLDGVHLQKTLRVALIDRAGRPSELRTPPAPPPWHLVAAVLEWDALGLAERLEVLRIVAPLRLARREARGEARVRAASPGETVTAWLVRHGQGPRIRELLWEPLARATLNQDPAVAAAPPFVRLLAELFAGDPGDAAIGLATCPLETLYVEPARRFIEQHGGEVRTGAPARLALDGAAVTGARVEGARLSARAVVAAVPWFALVELFDDVPPEVAPLLDAARRRRASPIVSVHLWFDRPVLDVPLLGLPGRPMPWVFDQRPILGDAASRLALVASGAADLAGRSDDELVALAAGELLDALPEARAARLVRASVVREMRATFSLAPDEPPRPPTVTPLAGLFLAGDWIETGWPGTIESAVLSGHRAADAVDRALS
jgi:squalene-associated FAD-dependent desaturase